jgi:ribosome-associated translation inhibitor RaiA
MLIQVNTDNHIESGDELVAQVSSDLDQALKRFAAQITRVEVHLHDENADKSGARDKRCVIEARIRGLEPLAVSHSGPTVPVAVNGATDKMVRSLDRTFSKLRNARQREDNSELTL